MQKTKIAILIKIGGQNQIQPNVDHLGSDYESYGYLTITNRVSFYSYDPALVSSGQKGQF